MFVPIRSCADAWRSSGINKMAYLISKLPSIYDAAPKTVTVTILTYLKKA